MRNVLALLVLLVADPAIAARPPLAYPGMARVCVVRVEDFGRANVIPTTVKLGNDEVELTLNGGYAACGDVYAGEPIKLELSWVLQQGDPPADQRRYSVVYPALALKTGAVANFTICPNPAPGAEDAWLLESARTCARIEAAINCDPRKVSNCDALLDSEKRRFRRRLPGPGQPLF